MAIELDQIAPWGRTRREYELMFNLAPADLSSGILDCGGGPASFAAEMAAGGHHVVSADPIYRFSGAEIRARFEAVADPIMSGVRAAPEAWIWSFHRGPDDLLACRRRALEAFLSDYEPGLQENRYKAAELPELPFASASFGLAVCSHLLFLYSNLLSEAFHIAALREMCRVAHEVRIFPLLDLQGQPSPHLTPLQAALKKEGWESQIVTVEYELIPGGNQMLRIHR